METKPFWQSTTMNGLFAAIGGLLAAVVPMLLPKISSAEISSTWTAVLQAGGAIANAVGLIIAMYGRARTDGEKLTLTRQ